MEMESAVQPKAPVNPELETPREEHEEIRRLRLCRRMQAVTIGLCMAYVQTQLDAVEYMEDLEVDPEKMKIHVSRVCGLTEKDFEREDLENGTE